ncbi:hypothetical protein SPRG_06302 [Saprolegnia parasitica CBS 223.65]|uniref:PX domain-containing protein n=1 Tax=Saprolegnia parasitica (strain CBS 223.65) TaxID=695850 RepID=A0A067CN81_SAPPC|nr:hypothetical protein SPRG_06302 [Saprolegnia parasitica CBS 223.65]KDO28252.1 hypothetical protein SPRG_06302 [Saprolegnia parasitica CBS 223.65]|eukprot:XP_012201074.1 hypothetical protein SPRG_06302 [Saprolegnia parasitica CBS 223.65]
MEGPIHVASTAATDRAWHARYVKLDDISAQLFCYRDHTIAETKWALPLHGADVSTPLPGAPTHGIAMDAMPYCILLHLSTGDVVCLGVADLAAKKAWSAKLLHVASHGPRQHATFAKQESDDFTFAARVADVRVDAGYAEYKVQCACRFFNVAYARHLSIEWVVWHRFAHFAALDNVLRTELPKQMAGIPFLHQKRDVLRTLLGHALEDAFLAQRRTALDTYLCKVVEIRDAVAFLTPTCNAALKVSTINDKVATTIILLGLFEFETHCSHEDVVLTKKEARARTPRQDKPKAPTKPKLRATSRALKTDAVSSVTTPTTSKKKHKDKKKADAPRTPEGIEPPPPPPTCDKPQLAAPVVSVPPARANLLAQIQQGTKLRSVR